MIQNSFFMRHKWVQLLIPVLVFWVYSDPIIRIHPFTATLIILLLFVLYGYIENRLLLKHINVKQKNQEELIKAICKSSNNIITYRDFNGKYIYANQTFMDIFNLKNEDEIKGKTEKDFLSKEDMLQLKGLTEKALSGQVVKKVIRLGVNKNYYDVLITPLIITNDVFGVITIAQNITEAEQLKKQVAENEKRLTSILNSMPMATYLKDLEGHVLYENAMAEKFLGFTDDDTSNKWRYKQKHSQEVKDEDATVIQKAECISVERRITLKNEDTRWFNVTKCPIFDEEQKVVGICAVARDIELEKEAHEQRETYVATLTHDLKTPTIAQIKALDILLSQDFGSLTKDQKDLLNMTKDSCEYMYEMISTLLSTYKYENGDYKLNYEDCNIHELISESCDELETLLKERNIKIYISNSKNIPIIQCDKIQIKRVIVNILSNAISYAYENSTISLMVVKSEDEVIVKIENKSHYINPTLMANIFKKYVSHADKFNKIGAGLGLYLAKQIIDAHKGQIIAESFEDERNIFGFKLPIKLFTSATL